MDISIRRQFQRLRYLKRSPRLTLSIWVFLLSGSATWAQEECISIENDIARLACYDEAFSKLSGKKLSPADAFENHRKLVSSSGADTYGSPIVVDVSFDPDTCIYVIGRGMTAGWGTIYEALVMNAGTIADFGVDPGRGATKYSVNRGNHLRTYFRQTDKQLTKNDLMELASKTNAFLLESGYNNDDPTIEKKPFAWIDLTTDESQVDLDKIYSSFGDIVQSCKER